MSRPVYADQAATTRPAPEVVEAMRPFLAEEFGNPSSVHRRGEAARGRPSIRATSAAGRSGDPEEIGSRHRSEGNNLALNG